MATLGDARFKTGIAVQTVSACLFVLVLFAIRLRWIDAIEWGLENGIDGPAPKLNALRLFMQTMILSFGTGLGMCWWAFFRNNRNQRHNQALHDIVA